MNGKAGIIFDDDSSFAEALNDSRRQIDEDAMLDDFKLRGGIYDQSGYRVSQFVVDTSRDITAVVSA